MPTTVRTGCGQRRPLAQTSPVPEHVTCLPCREHAHRVHEDQARMFDQIAGQAALDPEQARSALSQARTHRDLARRYC